MATISNSCSLFPFFILQLIVLSSAGGFTIDLIHRDSPKSPFYVPSETKSDRFTNAIRRSFARASHFQKQNTLASNDIQSRIIPSGGEYLMNVSIGTPRYNVLAVADTGSELSWTQCKPCTNCYKQKAPLFDPKKSSTYKALTCQASACNGVSVTSCTKGKENCQYELRYGDRSFSRGDLAVETFSFGSSSGRARSFRKKVFGCGFSNTGTFNESATGIVGLGRGPLSIVTQLSKVIHGKFAYCLVDLESNSTSKMKFGKDAVVSGKGVVSTPIVKGEGGEEGGGYIFYYLTLESISVGRTRIDFYKTKLPSEAETTSASKKGNIIIDSGTTVTFLPKDLYESLENELVRVIKKPTTQDPQGFLKLCYSDTTTIHPPPLTFNFEGAKVVLPPSSTFIRNGELLCLAMVPTPFEFAIFGNLSQKNFLIGYDVKNSVLSFKPADCEKQ